MGIQIDDSEIGSGRSLAFHPLSFGLRAKLVLWFSVSLALSLIFFGDFWASLGMMLSPDWVFGQYHAAPWGVLALCFIWLWLKRKQLLSDMNQKVSFAFFIPGVALATGTILMPSSLDFLVFQVLLASLGVFFILFGSGARIPSILLGIYGFSISFPLIIHRFAELPYSMGAIKPVVWIKCQAPSTPYLRATVN